MDERELKQMEQKAKFTPRGVTVPSDIVMDDILRLVAAVRQLRAELADARRQWQFDLEQGNRLVELSTNRADRLAVELADAVAVGVANAAKRDKFRDLLARANAYLDVNDYTYALVDEIDAALTPPTAPG
jgi:hypothetical protein